MGPGGPAGPGHRGARARPPGLLPPPGGRGGRFPLRRSAIGGRAPPGGPEGLSMVYDLPRGTRSSPGPSAFTGRTAGGGTSPNCPANPANAAGAPTNLPPVRSGGTRPSVHTAAAPSARSAAVPGTASTIRHGAPGDARCTRPTIAAPRGPAGTHTTLPNDHVQDQGRHAPDPQRPEGDPPLRPRPHHRHRRAAARPRRRARKQPPASLRRRDDLRARDHRPVQGGHQDRVDHRGRQRGRPGRAPRSPRDHGEPARAARQVVLARSSWC